MNSDNLQRKRLGSLLVGLQFGLILFLGWTGVPAFSRGQFPVLTLLLALAGGAVGLWALWANRPGNFNIRPLPRAGGQLVESGPYRWIRHPMYTGVLACGGAAAWSVPTLWSGLALVALGVVLLTKARLEERWMLQVHPDYASYQARTWRLLPGIY
jgi:protein-S-isoprenylcysteine O-methyltransferase Ste14